jgi:O-antigen/teichoic acid export membrane protein
MVDFREKLISGFNWSLGSQVSNQGLAFITSIVLARLLSPVEFGLLGMVIIFSGFADIFKEFGINASIIHWKNPNEKDLSTAFWLSIFSGGGMGVLIFLLARPIALFYGKPSLGELVQFIALHFFLTSFSILPTTLLQKKFDFRSLFWASFISELLSGGLAIALAFHYWGVWSLIARMIAKAIGHFFLVLLFSGWLPKLTFSGYALKKIFRFAYPLTGTRSINYWMRNLDNLLIGKFIGDQALGNYSRAYSFLMLPLYFISNTITNVLFPAFSLIQDNPDKIKYLFLRSTRMVALFSFPFFTMLLITAEPLVLWLLGAKWMAVIPLLRIFSLTGFLQSAVILIGIIFLSLGKTMLQFQLGLLTGSIGILCILIGLKWGTAGIASGLLIATLLSLVPNIFFAGKLIGISLAEWIINLKSIFACCILMGTLVYFVALFSNDWGYFPRLIVTFSSGAIFYYFLIMIFEKESYKYLINLIIGNRDA